MRHSVISLSLFACCAALAAPAQANEFYVKAGIMGAGVGYSHSISNKFALRAEVTTLGTIKRVGSIKRDSHLNAPLIGKQDGHYSLKYKATLQSNQFGIYGDWFPFDNGFRVSSGVQLRNQQVRAKGRINGYWDNKTGQREVANGWIKGRVKFPTVAPYLGIGWGGGSHVTDQKGFGFVFDLGVSFGRPKTSLTVDPKLQNHGLVGSVVEKELARDRKKLHNLAGKLKILPQVYVGVSYRF